MESVSSKGMYVCETNGRPIRKHIYVLGRLVSTWVVSDDQGPKTFLIEGLGIW